MVTILTLTWLKWFLLYNNYDDTVSSFSKSGEDKAIVTIVDGSEQEIFYFTKSLSEAQKHYHMWCRNAELIKPKNNSKFPLLVQYFLDTLFYSRILNFS